MIVFTVITDGYDTLKEAPKNAKVRYVCITDNVEQESKGWELLDIKKLNPHEGLKGRKLQRWAKITGAVEYFKEDTIYIDGSYEIHRCLSELFTYVTTDLCLKQHPLRNTIKEEVEACIKRRKDTEHKLLEQWETYKDITIRPEIKMYETGVLFRKYTTSNRNLCAVWWRELQRHSIRDQISLPVALNYIKREFEIITDYHLKNFALLRHHG